MSKLFRRLKFNLGFIGFSRNLAVISVIGLSISVAMITQNILFLNSFRNNAFSEFSQTVENSYIETDIQHMNTFTPNILAQIENTIDNTIEDQKYEETKLFGQEWFFYKFFYLLVHDTTLNRDVFMDAYLIGLDPEFIDQLDSLISVGTTPGTYDFTYITNSETLATTNIDNETSFGGYVPVSEERNPWESYSEGIPTAGKDFEFTGIVNIDDVSFEDIDLGPEYEALISMIFRLSNQLIITTKQNYINVLNSISYAINDGNAKGRVIFDLTKFNVFDLNNEINQLQILVNSFQQDIQGVVETFSANPELTIEAKIIPVLSGFRREYRIFQIFILVFMIPTLVMALSLVSFAMNQIKKQRDLHTQIMYQRGASRRMLFLYMLFELFIYSILAVLVGLLIGWPYSLLAIKSDGFFSFARNASIPDFNWTITAICLGAGFGVAFLSNIGSIWRRSRLTMTEALEERKEKKPFWERYYIDVFLLIIGIVMWIIARTQISQGTEAALEFAFYFATPAPIFIITSVILLGSRFYPAVVKYLSNLLFKIHNLEINAVAARNAIRRKGSTIRTIVLMTLTFALTVSSMIVPTSYSSYDSENTYYNLGADIVVQDVDVETDELKNTVNNLTGIEGSTYITQFDLTNSESDIVYDISIMGVELDNFSKIIYHESEYTNKRGFANVLDSINDSMDVVGQASQLEILNLGSNTTFVLQNFAVEGVDVVQKNYPVNFVDSFQYCPIIYTEPPSSTQNIIPISILGNISLPFVIARYDYEVSGSLLVKVKEGYDPSQLAEEIESITRLETLNIKDQLLISEGSLKATVLFGSLNTSFIISMLISSATIVLMMVIQAIEREKEIAIMKSMGISPLQLFNFFITEAFIILFFTMVLGVILGVITSNMIMRILRINTILPPHEMVYPIARVAWTTFVIFGVGLLSSIIPIIINTRRETSSALKTI
ncbi:MAG: FtsX-like permease family protein [Asgard group archaeon]|nr:FtsX-like permease family protein [Asgard group archaeon]